MRSASGTNDITCPICLDNYMDPVRTLCGHRFCHRRLAAARAGRCVRCAVTQCLNSRLYLAHAREGRAWARARARARARAQAQAQAQAQGKRNALYNADAVR